MMIPPTWMVHRSHSEPAPFPMLTPCACPGAHKPRCVPCRPGPTTRPHHPARSTVRTRSQAWPDRCRADRDASSASPSHETAPEPCMVAGRCHSGVPPPLLAASLRAGGMGAARVLLPLTDLLCVHAVVASGGFPSSRSHSISVTGVCVWGWGGQECVCGAGEDRSVCGAGEVKDGRVGGHFCE
jgi:hypothetical protein